MGDSILSQAEIDALLNGDSDTKNEPAGIASDSDIHTRSQYPARRVVRERLQALEIINEEAFRAPVPDIGIGPNTAPQRILPWAPLRIPAVSRICA